MTLAVAVPIARLWLWWLGRGPLAQALESQSQRRRASSQPVFDLPWFVAWQSANQHDVDLQLPVSITTQTRDNGTKSNGHERAHVPTFPTGDGMPISTSVYLTWNWHKVWYACFGVRITLFQVLFGLASFSSFFAWCHLFHARAIFMPSPPLSVPPYSIL